MSSKLMNCFNCGHPYREVLLEWKQVLPLGTVVVPDLLVERCDKCGPEEDIYPPESSKRIGDACEVLWATCKTFVKPTDGVRPNHCAHCGRLEGQHSNHD